MEKFVFIIKNLFYYLKPYKKEILFFGLVYLILLLNSIHEKYPDEMDNILGGYLINKGLLPYTGFFTHHGPLSYYLAGIITFVSGQSFVKFRFLSTVFYLILIIISFLIIKKRTKNISFFFLYITILIFSSTYYWLHMFLADPISGYLLIPAYALLFLNIYKKEVLKKLDLIIISIFSSLAVINSPTYSYSVFIIVFFTFFYFIFSNKIKFNLVALSRNIAIFAIIFASPYILFILFLLITGTFADYYFQALIYNKAYYVYNYPRPPGSTSLNPIRYAIIIFSNFFNAYQVLLAGIKNVDFINPVNVTLALSNLLLWIFLLLKRKYVLFLFSILIIIYVNVRSSPLNVKATDYQASVYLMITFFNASFILYILKDGIRKIEDYLERFFLTALLVIFIIYWFFSFIFLFGELWRMTYLRYMGEKPLIYDRPQVAPLINSLVSKNKYCWVGPFDFEEILYLNCKIPSRFHIIRPFFYRIDSFVIGMLSDFSKNKPDIIVYRHGVFRTGKDADDKFFLEFLNKNYITLKDLPGNIKFKNGKTQNFALDEEFYIEKINKDRLIKELFEKGYIEK